MPCGGQHSCCLRPGPANLANVPTSLVFTAWTCTGPLGPRIGAGSLPLSPCLPPPALRFSSLMRR
jgi:hypothetical protein